MLSFCLSRPSCHLPEAFVGSFCRRRPLWDGGHQIKHFRHPRGSTYTIYYLVHYYFIWELKG